MLRKLSCKTFAHETESPINLIQAVGKKLFQTNRFSIPLKVPVFEH